MGLAGPRKRTKISRDPNNTNWSRSTSGYGHRILSSQGWTPGSFLGARNAVHADTFTAASASHIRVSLKDDTLGLGARPKRDIIDRPTGVDAFQGLLGRLNGKNDEELEKEQRKRDDIRLALYAERKWQAVRFISGGLLVHDKIEALAGKHQRECDNQECGFRNTAGGRPPRPEENSDTAGSNKAMADNGETTVKASKSKRSKQMDSSIRIDKDHSASTSERKHKKKSKKRKQTDGSGESDDDDDVRIKEISDEPAESPKALLPKAVPASRERIPMGRHVFRSRHIQQKKRALMDDKSLNEIFMIKS